MIDLALFLTEADVTELLTMEMALAAVEEALRLQGEGKGLTRPRQRVQTGRMMLQAMPAGTPDHAGLKFYASGAGGTRFWVPLFDAQSGELLCLMQADRLGQMRTGAASGVATKYLARPDATVLGVFGTGWQAQSQVEAVCAVRRITAVRVFGRNQEKAEAFCRTMAERTGASYSIAEEPNVITRGADIVTTITTARSPLFDGHLLRPGTHLNAAGSNRISSREVDAATISRAALVVVDSVEQAKIESGDLVAAEKDGSFRWERAVELGDIIAGRRTGRSDPAQITLFESHGIALWDVLTAARVYALAVERGMGRTIDL